jgi:heterotetrameric sarcosine oxidase delta subunit
MLLIHCPWCGSRDESEFQWGGPAKIVRPERAAISDAAWVDYLFFRDND